MTMSFITCVMEVKPLLTLWEGRRPGSVSPFSVLTLPPVPPTYWFLAVKPCFLWGHRWKSVLVSGPFSQIPSSMAIVSLPVIRHSGQKHLTTDLGERRSPVPLLTRPLPLTLLPVTVRIIPPFTPAGGWQGSLWRTMLILIFQGLQWRIWFLLPLLHSLSITLESMRPWVSRTQFSGPPWPWLVWVEVEGCEKWKCRLT